MKVLVTASLSLALFVAPAMADSLKVVKTFPGQPQILVDQGSDDGLEAGAKVALILKSGKRITTRVKKSNGARAILEIPQVYQDRFKISSQFSYEISDGKSANRKTASMMDYSARGSSRGGGKNSLKVLAGTASAGMASSIIVFGADYVIPVARNITLSPGISYWSTSSGVEDGDTWSFLTADAAVGYHIPIQKKVDVELGGRIGLSRSSVTYPATSFAPEESFSTMGMLITPYSGVGFAFSKTGSAGAEFRLPLSGSSDIGLNMFYGMGFVKFSL